MREWAPTLSIKFREIFILFILAFQDSLRLLLAFNDMNTKKELKTGTVFLSPPQKFYHFPNHILLQTPLR